MEYYSIDKVIMFAKIGNDYIEIGDFNVIDIDWTEPEEFKI